MKEEETYLAVSQEQESVTDMRNIEAKKGSTKYFWIEKKNSYDRTRGRDSGRKEEGHCRSKKRVVAKRHFKVK